MALPGDDEIDCLLDMMGSGDAPSPVSSPLRPPVDRRPSSKQSDVQGSKDKSKKQKKKRKRKSKEGKADLKKNPTMNSADKTISFAETRLSQNCFEWPSNNGQRSLVLGPGLLHNCKEYVYSSSDQQQNGCYGSSVCKSCGKPAVTHELCLSSSLVEGTDGAAKESGPPTVVSIARIIVALRNARCLMGEYHATSKSKSKDTHGNQMKSTGLSGNVLLPPLNSTVAFSDVISEKLDVFIGRTLGCARKILSAFSGIQNDQLYRASVISISATDVQLLQEKVTSLVKSAQDYKQAMDIACSNASARDSVAIDLVEKRLMAMAACDAVYYRCYYAVAVSNTVGGGLDTAALIPHPPTYFSCPGLAWDVHGAGVESFRIFFGESNNSELDDLAAPLNESTRQILLKQWGLNERLSSTASRAKNGAADWRNQTNPFLTLWQSRLFETIRNVWCTRYSEFRSSIALREASNSTNDKFIRSRIVESTDSQLEIHETRALSLAAAEWRDSIRDYPANFYAYAAPTKDALNAISGCFESSDIKQILEAGAGTGYWSALLLSGLEKNEIAPGAVPAVLPYDVVPPSSPNDIQGNTRPMASNEYHGNIPTFTDVQKAASLSQVQSASATSGANTALLLCYPPPGCDMAQKTLSAHISNGGHTVMHIGEWQGLTGDDSFEALLAEEFYCQENDVLPLPWWSTDATYLTIWKKKSTGKGGNAQEQDAGSCSPALGYCSAKQCSNRAKRRCRYARCLQYCSSECCKQDSFEVRAVLALHMIASKDEMKYEDDCHFMDLKGMSASRDVVSDERPKKKRKKKRR